MPFRIRTSERTHGEAPREVMGTPKKATRVLIVAAIVAVLGVIAIVVAGEAAGEVLDGTRTFRYEPSDWPTGG